MKALPFLLDIGCRSMHNYLCTFKLFAVVGSRLLDTEAVVNNLFTHLGKAQPSWLRSISIVLLVLFDVAIFTWSGGCEISDQVHSGNYVVKTIMHARFHLIIL